MTSSLCYMCRTVGIIWVSGVEHGSLFFGRIRTNCTKKSWRLCRRHATIHSIEYIDPVICSQRLQIRRRLSASTIHHQSTTSKMSVGPHRRLSSTDDHRRGGATMTVNPAEFSHETEQQRAAVNANLQNKIFVGAAETL